MQCTKKMDDWFCLNVGGIQFWTTCTTLKTKSSFFSGLVESADLCDRCANIDRDPFHFRYILNYLRGSKCVPSCVQDLKELRAEADFYGLNGYVNIINAELRQPLYDSAYQLQCIRNSIPQP